MRKIIALILATLMILFAFASCNNSESKETEGQKETYSETQTEKQSDTEKGTDDSDKNNSNKDDDSENDNIDDSGNIDDWNKGTYTRNENKITFGYYPQTKVTDTNLIAALTNKAGTLPTSQNSQAWTSYAYYAGGKVENFMWYIDVFNGGEKYRGVYFTSYRPYETTVDVSSTHGAQKDNGYLIDTVHWFKYEPITWTILNENTTDGSALILCDMVIDSQEYYISDSEIRTIDGKTIYPNNYEYSMIRIWLNDNFYNTAFNDLQKAMMVTTVVDNSTDSTSTRPNSYASNDTEDKIFMLSFREDLNFVDDSNNMDRNNKITDYAKVQGIRMDNIERCRTWLRSPDAEKFGRVNIVDYNCNLNYYSDVCYTNIGVVPALQIKL